MRIAMAMIFIYLILGCGKEDLPLSDLDSSWELTEFLLDPGDGSGTFQIANYEKQLVFMSNGTIRTSRSFCDPSQDELGMTGTYNSELLTFVPDDCGDESRPYTYQINGNEMLVYAPCIESCIEKYARVLPD